MIPPPVALGLALCDYVILEERTKKVSLIGRFGSFSVPRFPAAVAPFSVYALLTDGLGDARVELVVLRMDTDQGVFVYRGSFAFPRPFNSCGISHSFSTIRLSSLRTIPFHSAC
jgi:Family of unknown function (DUF6941)